MQKVIVYVDGFNFYYGLKKNHKWRRFYWLDVVKFFELFMKPDQELVRVKYFSAKPDNVEKALRQNAFSQANKENPKFQLMLGKYLRKKYQVLQLRLSNSNLRGERIGCQACNPNRQ